MKVKLTTHMVGDDFSHPAGTILDTDEAVRLITAGVAVPHIEPDIVETAHAVQPVERAIKARAKKPAA